MVIEYALWKGRYIKISVKCNGWKVLKAFFFCKWRKHLKIKENYKKEEDINRGNIKCMLINQR